MIDEDQTDVDTSMTDEDMHAELQEHGIKLHHKTGTDKLASVLAEVRAGTYKPDAAVADVKVTAPVAPVKELTKEQHEKKLTKEQRAMQLVRIIVSPNDPLMSGYNGLIFTVGSSAINKGRMIKKYVPFNNEEGWHVPRIIYDQIESAQMQKFRPIKLPNGDKTMQAYLAKKFNVEVLPSLSKREIEALAAAQSARGEA